MANLNEGKMPEAAKSFDELSWNLRQVADQPRAPGANQEVNPQNRSTVSARPPDRGMPAVDHSSGRPENLAQVQVNR